MSQPFFLFEMSWRKLQLKSKLIHCFLYPLTLKGMSKLKTARRGSLEAYFTVQILFPGVLVKVYVTTANISHPISTERAEDGKLTLFSPDLTSVPVCCIYFLLFLLWPHIFPIGHCAILDLFLLCIIVLSGTEKCVYENHAFPNVTTFR